MSKAAESPRTPADQMAAPSPALPVESSRGARLLKVSLLITTLEGVVVFLGLVTDPYLVQGGWMAGATRLRWAILGTTTVLLAALTWLSVRAHADRAWLGGATKLVGSAASGRNLALLTVALSTSALFNIVALVGPSVRTNLEAEILLKPLFNRGQLLGIWMFLIVLQALAVLLAFSKDSIGHKASLFLAGGFVLGLLLLYWYGAEGQLLFYNMDMGATDQSAYMDYARLLKDSGYAYPGDFNRMPVYPFLLSFLLRQGMPDPKFFLAAKYFNLFLSVLLLAGLGALFYRRFPRLQALNLILIVAFTVFIYKAGWVQAELLFYFLNSCLFILMWRLLERPTYAGAVLAGLVAGLAHLTKASILPALVLFGLFGSLRGAVLWLQWRRSPEGRVSRASWVRGFLVVPLTVAAFLTVIFPYLRVSKGITGHAFYNVNSTFYVWYNSWEEAEAGTKAHGDRVGWPDMPPDEIPSLAKYLREHTAGEMIERVIDGGREVMNRVAHSYGYGDYILVYGGLLALALVWKWPQVRSILAENPFPLLFFLGYFPLYILLYFWYSPISTGNRLILAQFVPLLLVLSSGLQALLKEDRIRIAGKEIGWLTIIQLAILCMVSVDAFQALTHGVYVLDGGG